MICDKHKVIFVHIPRTSGTSIESLFSVNMDLEGGKHLRASELRKLAGEERWKTYFKFSIVRNPWERVGSMFNQPAFKDINFLSGKSIDYFLEHYEPKIHEHGTTCSDYLDDLSMDYIAKYENRKNDLKIISKKIGFNLNPRFNPIINRQTRNSETPWYSYFSEGNFEVVTNRYQEDICKFGYAVSEYRQMIRYAEPRTSKAEWNVLND